MTSPVFELADKYVSDLAAIDPISALELGLPVTHLSDFSPAGAAREADLARATLDKLATLPDTNEHDKVARLVMEERLGTALASHAAEDHLANLNILFCPVSIVRQAFDLLPFESEQDRSNWVSVLESVPQSLESWRQSLELGIERGVLAARRQAEEVAEQALFFGKDTFLDARATELDVLPARDSALAAFTAVGVWLRDVYAPAARVEDGVGAARYSREIRRWNGIDLDAVELWHWGWEELDRITTRMERIRDEVAPGRAVSELPAFFDADPRYQVSGEEAIVEFLRGIVDRATEELSAHFDIPQEVRFCDVRIAPAGSASAAYYIGASEDFSRPGTTWLPNVSGGEFHTWPLVSTWYHEGVPGHHLQHGYALVKSESLSRFQRTFGWISGYGEGWALYAERLMDELGYFNEPGIELGYLSAQALRASRIIVDAGMHLGLSVPEGTRGEVAGTPIDYDFSVDFLQRRALLTAVEAQSETVRYLGLPGQAVSYKLGERTILELRAAAQAKAGADFDLKAWHSWFLGLGPVGLETLKRLAA